MINIPEEVKNLIMTDGTRKNIRISFPDQERSDICNDQIVQNSVSFSESLCSQNEIKLGLCEASTFQCTVVGVENIRGYQIKVDLEIDCSSLGEEWCDENARTSEDLDFAFYSVPYGVFYVDKCTKTTGNGLGERQIEAYTKEAVTNWGVPISVDRAVKCGWNTAEIVKIPIKAILGCIFPNVIEDEYIRVTTTYGSGASSTRAYYFDENHSKKYIRQDIVYYRIIINGETSFTTLNDIRQGLVKYKVSLDKKNKEFTERCKNEIIRKITERGYDLHYEERILQYDDYCSIGRGMAYEGTYYGANTDTYEISPTDKSTNPTGVSTEYITKTTENCEFFYERIDSNIWVSTVGCNQIVLTVPAGVWIKTGEIYTPDWITENQTLFEGGNSIDYVTVSDVGVINVEVERDSFTTFRAMKTMRATGDFTYVNKNSYHASASLDTKALIEAYLETQGKLGKIERDGTISFVELGGRQALYPSETLYPSENLYPQGTDGYSVPSTYVSAWYDDYLSKPYGRICVTYHNESDAEEWAFLDLVENYNSDEYLEYTLTQNQLIIDQKWTLAQIKTFLQNIADSLNGIRYMPSKIEAMGQPWLEAGDTIAVETLEGGIIKTAILTRTLSGEQMLTDEYVSN